MERPPRKVKNDKLASQSLQESIGENDTPSDALVDDAVGIKSPTLVPSRYTPPPFGELFFLLEAFDHVGRHLFDSEWEGTEFEAAKVPDYKIKARDRLAAARAELTDIVEKSKELTTLQLRTTKDTDNRRNTETLQDLATASRALMNEIAALKPYEWGLDDELGRRERYEVTLKCVTNALADGSLRALYLPMTYIDRHSWISSAEFAIILPLSYVVRRRQKMAFRRKTVFVERNPFREWLARIEPINPGALEKLPPEIRARFVARKIVAAAPRPLKMDDFIKQLLEKVDDLSERAAQRIWGDKGTDMIVPQSWRAKGPKTHG